MNYHKMNFGVFTFSFTPGFLSLLLLFFFLLTFNLRYFVTFYLSYIKSFLEQGVVKINTQP